MKNSRGKRLIAWILCAVMMLALLPAQEAEADYHINDPCPVDGCEGVIEYHNDYSTTHCFVCSLHRDDLSHLFIEEPHFGGTATCMERGKCEGCHLGYIAVNLNNHDWVMDRSRGDQWLWSANGSIATVYLRCQRQGCGAVTTVTDDAPVPSNITYDAGTGKVSKTLTATVTMANGQTLSDTRNIETDPIPVNCVYLVAGVYYLRKPQSIPQSYNCHYEMDWWTYPVAFNQVVRIGDEYYLAANVDTMLYVAARRYISKVPGAQATCTADGYEEYWQCSECGKMYSEQACENEITERVTIDALGHDLKETKKDEPTCTEDGTEAYWTCQRDGCGKLFSDKEGKHEIDAPVTIDAPGHDLKETKKVEPTCTEDGTEAYWTCRRDGCGKLFSDKEGIHEIDAPVAIDALGHDLKETKKVEPTCTEDGTEAYWTCRRDGCGKMFSDEEGEHEIDAPAVIPARGHTPADAVKEHEKAAEVGVAGSYDEVVYCAACGTELSRKTVETDPLPEPEPQPAKEEAEPLVKLLDETGAVELRFFPGGVFTVRVRGMWVAEGSYALEDGALTLEIDGVKTPVPEDGSLGFALGGETYTFAIPEDALAILSGGAEK